MGGCCIWNWLEKEDSSVYLENHMIEGFCFNTTFFPGRLIKKGLCANLSVAYCKMNFMVAENKSVRSIYLYNW